MTRALVFSRKPARFAAAAVAGRAVPGAGATVGPLKLADVDELDHPTDEWVRFRPRLAGICGSDLATIDGRSSQYFEPIVSFPFTPGHEVVGELDDGSRAVLVPVLHCAIRGVDPVCPSCALGRTHHCERIAFGHLDPALQSGFCRETGGGWSTAMVAHPDQLVAVPDDMTDEAAVLVEPTACAVHAAHAVRASRAGADGAVAIIGAGTLGLTTLAALRHLDGRSGSDPHRPPHRTILATAKHPEQKRLAQSLGATRAVAPAELPRAIRSLTASMVLGEGQLTGGVPTVVDCVGSSESLAQALRVVAPGGDVIVVGMPGHTSVDLTPLWHRETGLRGCYAYTRDDFATAFDVVRDADLHRLLSATYPLDRHREAISHAAAAGSRSAVKIAFDLRQEKHR
ncbi:zinc-binding dehydrogenase [Iamia sp. SCSIO 61187]|uniref:zinc-dependent alcohol dehydrogenase n=1 Tax=Iamia sp. SCSIO 61187 TaxID=2722752 RepID=UPI001C62AA57|nr:zinc-binding dehydrogenase [Iamia sp. SCSIO 61187]QYG93601.1 zinc-binding dehydrogenase [Iamia sp. SCSIO 61187]